MTSSLLNNDLILLKTPIQGKKMNLINYRQDDNCIRAIFLFINYQVSIKFGNKEDKSWSHHLKFM